MKPKRKPVRVYVARGRLGYKIGIAVDVSARLRILRSEVQDRSIVQIKTWHRPKDARVVEYDAHHSLKGRRDWWARHYEWFDVPERVAIEAVEMAIARAKAGTSVKAGCRVARERRAVREREYAENMARWRAMYEAAAAEFERGS